MTTSCTHSTSQRYSMAARTTASERSLSTAPKWIFSKPSCIAEYDTLLFDMDGTIIDSTAAIVKHWHEVGNQIGVPGDVILKSSHGRRSVDVLRIHAPHLAEDPDWVRDTERDIPKKFGNDAVEIPGARALTERLREYNAPWGIVTSGTKMLCQGWLEKLLLPMPKVMITAESVSIGKPDPTCYIAGAKIVSETWERPLAAPERTLVFEDAPAGIQAGRAAGFQVVAVATTHSLEELIASGPSMIIKDLESVEIVRYWPEKGCVSVRVKDALWAAAEEADWKARLDKHKTSLPSTE